MDLVLQWDQELFVWVNEGMSNVFFDILLPYWRSKFVWFPAYVFLLSFLLINYKRQGLLVVCLLALTVGTADYTSSTLIKKNVIRPRPCHEVFFQEHGKLRVHCGGGYSFTSSHATNHFALAVAVILILGQRFRRIKIPLLFWAATIAFSQVYVGVHYPIDVFFGAILGSCIAYIWVRVIGKKIIKDFSSIN